MLTRANAVEMITSVIDRIENGWDFFMEHMAFAATSVAVERILSNSSDEQAIDLAVAMLREAYEDVA